MQEISFDNNLYRFIRDINSLKSTLSLLLSAINEELNSAKIHLDQYLSKYATEIKTDDHGNKNFILNGDHFRQVSSMTNQIDHLNNAKKLLPKNYLVSLISQYDAFLGGLISVIYFIKPELLNSNEKNISFCQLNSFKTIDDVKQFIIEKEVDAVIRDSHINQIKWLETKLSIKLREDLNIWTNFVEITERRNLFVHTDGKVSSQYLYVCRENKVVFENEPSLGDCLDVSDDYFSNACNYFFEMGVKLTSVFWRKLSPDDRKNADSSLNQICYSLISLEEYDLAINLLKFATEIIKKHSSEENFLYMLLNKAQAYKWNNQLNMCESILNSVDWSAKNETFQLVRLVLLDDFEKAAKLMKRVANIEGINKIDYKDWPIFKEFRKSSHFQKSYEEIYNEKFQIDENYIPTDVEDECRENYE